jgi:hypothetical protein
LSACRQKKEKEIPASSFDESASACHLREQTVDIADSAFHPPLSCLILR